MSGNIFLPDTNAVGLYLDNKRFAANYLKQGAIISISVITQFEFFIKPALTIKSKFFFEKSVELIEIYLVVRENKDLLKKVVAIQKKYKLKLPDAIIASTAIVNNAPLHNADAVFSKIHNIKFQFIKS